MTNSHRCLALAALIPLSCGTESDPAEVASTFDTSDDGWVVIGDATKNTGKADHAATGGNPGGYISAKDAVLGGVWFFVAPSRFGGDHSALYGRHLAFDLRTTDASRPFVSEDVVLEGNGATIVYDRSSPPGSTWTPYRIRLDESAGWKKGSRTGALATSQDIKAVLFDLRGLRIRGEFNTGPDTGSIDNVRLGAP